jgi:hypothetical protein
VLSLRNIRVDEMLPPAASAAGSAPTGGRLLIDRLPSGVVTCQRHIVNGGVESSIDDF